MFSSPNLSWMRPAGRTIPQHYSQVILLGNKILVLGWLLPSPSPGIVWHGLRSRETQETRSCLCVACSVQMVHVSSPIIVALFRTDDTVMTTAVLEVSSVDNVLVLGSYLELYQLHDITIYGRCTVFMMITAIFIRVWGKSRRSKSHQRSMLIPQAIILQWHHVRIQSRQ
ncbi:hypothetical protein F5884DRAFT_783251 [Xylogone sp. PMI_703]|nr:hypothetical protein F5884DRAFT_783251 [Xylogone sp. PMI_703]